MITLITGATHTGKTLLARELALGTGVSCLSLDLLKMGLIRSGFTDLTPYDDDELEGLMWPIVSEMIRTAGENGRDLIVEGGYIPENWQQTFKDAELKGIKAFCIVMTKGYIETNFDEIVQHANAIESRMDDSDLSASALVCENERYGAMCENGAFTPLLVDRKHDVRALAAKVIESW